MGRILVNIDFDGVLISNRFEKILIEHLSYSGFSAKLSFPLSNSILDWYFEMIGISPLAPLNFELLKFFAKNMNKYALRLWTNRYPNQRKKTLLNLEPFKYVFDSFHFYAGDKEKYKVEGVVIDNNPKYLKCGELGIHYRWEGGKNVYKMVQRGMYDLSWNRRR